ncbi:hypothetical protein [Maricaulis virginensis]|uniref:hypothetical protein n=1 Tax=Maricaulis virginensis TaxID=144022 RepID=UPI0022F28F4F|nr:hypothetical protein [Maricaulis virginensis]
MSTIYGAQSAFQAFSPLWRQWWISVMADELMIQSVGGAKPYVPVVINRQQDADWLIFGRIADKNVANLQPYP